MKNLTKISIVGLFVLSLVSMQPKSVYAVDIIYWTDLGTDTSSTSTDMDGKIYRMNTDGTGFTTIIDLNGEAYNPADVAVDNRGDPTTWKVYWTDNHEGTSNGFIQRSDYDGSNVAIIFVAGGLDDLKGLDIDIPGGKLYYSQGNDVRSINLDGTGDTSILTAGILAGLDPDPSGAGFVEYTHAIGGAAFLADGTGRLQEIAIGFDLGITVDDDNIAGVDGGNFASAFAYDEDSANVTMVFTDASNTVFYGTDPSNTDEFTTTSLKFSDVDMMAVGGDVAYVTVNNSSGTADRIYKLNFTPGTPLTVSPLSLYTDVATTKNYSGITVVNPELPPGMLGYLAMMLSFMVVWLRSRFHFHH